MILVTGATGFVGTHVVHALRAEDRPVRVLVRDPSKATQLSAWGCELARGDVTEPDSLPAVLDGCDSVIHLVAIITGKPSDFERIMVEGTRALLSAAKEAGARRFVHMSALGVSEDSKDLVPYYGAKWAMEGDVRNSGLDFTIFRPSFIFGRDGGVLPMFIGQVRWLPVTPVAGDGNRRSQPIWVDDVAAFFAKALSTPGSSGEAYDLGGPDTPTWNELFEAIQRALGKQRPLVHIPIALLRANAAVLERLPRPPLTRDQLKMLEYNDNVGDVAPAMERFGIEPMTLEEQLTLAVSGERGT